MRPAVVAVRIAPLPQSALASLVVLLLVLSGCVAPGDNETDPDATPSPSMTGTGTPSPTPSETPSASPSQSPSPSPSNDPSPTPTDEPTTHTVQIGVEQSGALADYSPESIEIVVGDSVVWENLDSVTHTATATEQGDRDWFDTGNVRQDETSDAIVFDTVGTFEYYCKIHPSTMTGATVVVSEA